MKNVIMTDNKSNLQAKEDVLSGRVRNIKSNQILREIILTNEHAPVVYYPDGNAKTLDFYLTPTYY